MRAHRGFVTFAPAVGLIFTLAAGNAQAIPVFYQTGEDAFEVAPMPDDLSEQVADRLIAQGLGSPEERADMIGTLREGIQDRKIGYRCSVFGLFFAYMHWWDCKQVLFNWTTSDSFEYIPTNEKEWEAHMQSQTTDAEELATEMMIFRTVIAVLEEKAGGKELSAAYPLSAAKMGFWKKNGRWILLLALVGIIVATILMKRNKAETGGSPPMAGGQSPPTGGQFPPTGGQVPPPGGQQFGPPGGQQFGPPGGQVPPNQG